MLEKTDDDGGGRWRVVEANVLPRVKNPNGTQVGHERVENADDPTDIWDVPKFLGEIPQIPIWRLISKILKIFRLQITD